MLVVLAATGAVGAVVRGHMLPNAEVANGECAYVADSVGSTFQALACAAVHAK